MNETWDTGEVRLHLQNDENLYNAARRELPGIDEDHTEADHLWQLWSEHDLNPTVNVNNVDWELLADEVIEDLNTEDAEDYSADELASAVYAHLSELVATYANNHLLRPGLLHAQTRLQECVLHLDVSSSASCQHYIDTGRYLRKTGVRT